METKQNDLDQVLYQASASGNVSWVRQLLQCGARGDWHNPDQYFWTAIHRAAFNGHYGVVREILKKGVNPNIKDQEGGSPLHDSSREGHSSVVALLLKYGADPNMKNDAGQTPAQRAAYGGKLSVLEELIKANAKLDVVDEDLDTLLHDASGCGHQSVVNWLLHNGATVNLTNKHGRTPLHLAAAYGNLAVAKILLSNGALANHQSKNEDTPLHEASLRGHCGVVNLLLLNGADILLRNKDGKLPEECAESKSMQSVFHLWRSEKTSASHITPQTDCVVGHAGSPKIVELMKKYESDGLIRLTSLRFIITGPPRVGKTTLKCRLLEELTNLSENSTSTDTPTTGLERCVTVHAHDYTRFSTSFSWKEKDLYHEVQLIMQHVMLSCQRMPPHQSRTDSPIRRAIGTARPCIPVPTKESTRKLKFSGIRYSQKLMQEVLDNIGLKEIEDIENIATLYLMDTGGQPEFHDIIPIVLRGPALHLVCFNLAFNLDEPVKVTFCKPDGSDAEVSYTSSYTNREMIHQVLSSVSFLSESIPPQHVECKSRSLQSNYLPTALIVGTHKDLVQESELKEISDSLEATLKNSQFWEEDFVRVPSGSTIFFPVDNQNGTRDEICKLQHLLKGIIMKRFRPTLVPASWTMFNLALRHKFEKSPGFCSFKDCIALAIDCGIDESDVGEVLRYIHYNIGTVLYYKEVAGMNKYIICSPKLLLDAISRLIAISFVGNDVFPHCAKKIKSTGEIPYRIVFQAISGSCDEESPFSNENIIKLLKKFRIATDVDDGKEKKLFMPCLMYSDLAIVSCVKSREDIRSIYPPPLLIQFKGKYVPVGVFSGLIVKLIASNWKLSCKDRYRNRMSFYVGGYETEIMARASFLEVRVHLPSSKKCTDLAPYCNMVRQEIVRVLLKVLKRNEYTRKLVDFQLGFYCPGGLQSESTNPHFCAGLASDSSSCTLSGRYDCPPKSIVCCGIPPCAEYTSPSDVGIHYIWYHRKVAESVAELQAAGLLENPTMKNLQSLEYCDRKGNRKHLYLLQRIQPKWKNIGIALGADPYSIECISKEHSSDFNSCSMKMMMEWLQKSDSPTWNAIHDAMKQVKDYNTATELEVFPFLRRC